MTPALLKLLKERAFLRFQQQLMNSAKTGFSVGLATRILSDWATELQYQLVLQQAYATKIDQLVRQSNALKCVTEGARSCFAKGRWSHRPISENGSQLITPNNALHDIAVNARLYQKQTYNRIWQLGARAPIRMWCRSYEDHIEYLEKMVKEHSHPRKESENTCREEYEGFYSKCKKRGFTL